MGSLNGISDISDMALFTGYNIYVPSVYCRCLPLFIKFCQMFERRHTPSAYSSLLMFRIARISFSCVVPGPSQWFFHFGEEIVIAWTHIGWVWWLFQNLPLSEAQKVRDSSSGVTPCIVVKKCLLAVHRRSASNREARSWTVLFSTWGRPVRQPCISGTL